MRYFDLILYSSLFVVLNACQQTAPKQATESSEEVEGREAIRKIPGTNTSYHHQVMVLGTFHFNRNRDGSDVVGKNHLDISSPESQTQIDSLVSRMVTGFKPTIIAVEWMPNWQSTLDSLYQEYLNDNWQLGKNEAFQIGFRVAKALDLGGVKCIDNRPPQPESVTSVDDWDQYARQHGQEILWKEYDGANQVYNDYLDQRLTDLDLLQYLRLLNSPENLKRSKQLWLTGLVNLGVGDQYLGADLTGHWYRRNTRIFVNARNLCQTKNERILIIYGNAHKWVLEELFEGSPEFKVVAPPF